MKTKFSLIFALLLSFTLSAYAGESAADVLSRASARFRAAKSIEATFTLTSSAQAGVIKGTILMSGQKFRITAPQYTSWYDGTTQWVLNAADREVTVSAPTAQELQMINPVMVVNMFSKQYTATLLKSPKTQRVIRLTAKQKKADIRQAVVTLDSSSLLPQTITLTASNGTTVTVKLVGTKIGSSLADAYFRFSPKAYPGVDIIDLR